jgi:L,D-transpeptidase YcbB
MNNHSLLKAISITAAVIVVLALLGACGRRAESGERPPGRATASPPAPATTPAERGGGGPSYWVTSGGPNKNAGILRAVLAAADTHGLNPQAYGLDEIGRLWDRKDDESLARLESLLTMALGNYSSDMTEGRHQPRDFDPQAFPTACDCEVDRPALLERALAAPDLKAFLEGQAPPFDEYLGLREKLAEYRTLAARGGWTEVPPGPKLKPGDSDPRVGAVRRRLAVTGEWPTADPADNDTYDGTLAAAVMRFQRHHGLDPDGVIGPGTLAALNVPVERRIRQLIVNMETWRWVARDRGDWWITVNIPSFRLTAVRGGKAELSMAVVVGDESHMTPVFSDRLRTVEFNPYWNVPLSISRKEFLPKLRKDPAYLKKQHIRMFEGWSSAADEVDSAAVEWGTVSADDMGRYRLRQDPGADNALGHFAFIFPNAFDVYLHDTPALGLFEQTKRTFSHGCIRVARAHDLAAYVLGGEEKGWTQEKLNEMLATGQNQSVRLDRPVPIYILYNTAVVDRENRDVYFFNDVYGRDALLEKAIF